MSFKRCNFITHKLKFDYYDHKQKQKNEFTRLSILDLPQLTVKQIYSIQTTTAFINLYLQRSITITRCDTSVTLIVENKFWYFRYCADCFFTDCNAINGNLMTTQRRDLMLIKYFWIEFEWIKQIVFVSYSLLLLIRYGDRQWRSR